MLLVEAICTTGLTYTSLETKHLILVWIMTITGPENQADFIEVLYTHPQKNGNMVREWSFIAQILKLFPSVLKSGAP